MDYVLSPTTGWTSGLCLEGSSDEESVWGPKLEDVGALRPPMEAGLSAEQEKHVTQWLTQDHAMLCMQTDTDTGIGMHSYTNHEDMSLLG